ncbi:Dvir\GJ14072-PA-like protein [Anopheles sinensis]|uniref:Dvir\GJ14072-PA-like protein n=1 Tax=Anopheles sinensis TaxID=74873 RepID=A0A084VWE2_ANOSI|nr:Dvir\GJ14072-PA-like protein [Anopheles sinensis]
MDCVHLVCVYPLIPSIVNLILVEWKRQTATEERHLAAYKLRVCEERSNSSRQSTDSTSSRVLQQSEVRARCDFPAKTNTRWYVTGVDGWPEVASYQVPVQFEWSVASRGRKSGHHEGHHRLETEFLVSDPIEWIGGGDEDGLLSGCDRRWLASAKE